jgi:hypothetical protein
MARNSAHEESASLLPRRAEDVNEDALMYGSTRDSPDALLLGGVDPVESEQEPAEPVESHDGRGLNNGPDNSKLAISTKRMWLMAPVLALG